MRNDIQRELNQRTCDFFREMTGLELSETEAEEFRQSLVQYSRILLEIAQEQQKPKEAGAYEP